MARSYPPEFRCKVLDLLAAGKKVAEVAEALGVSGQTIYNWRNQDRIDRGEAPGLTSAERVELPDHEVARRVHHASGYRPRGRSVSRVQERATSACE